MNLIIFSETNEDPAKCQDTVIDATEIEIHKTAVLHLIVVGSIF
jgi:hypothetical protein